MPVCITGKEKKINTNKTTWLPLPTQITTLGGGKLGKSLANIVTLQVATLEAPWPSPTNGVYAAYTLALCRWVESHDKLEFINYFTHHLFVLEQLDFLKSYMNLVLCTINPGRNLYSTTISCP